MSWSINVLRTGQLSVGQPTLTTDHCLSVSGSADSSSTHSTELNELNSLQRLLSGAKSIMKPPTTKPTNSIAKKSMRTVEFQPVQKNTKIPRYTL